MRKLYGVAENDVPLSTRKGSYTLRVYMVWQGILQRCFNKNVHLRRPNYVKATICERWLKFSNFLKDIDKIKGYEIWLNNPHKGISLDKDLLSNHSDEYSLGNCCFVTRGENSRECITRTKILSRTKQPVICINPDGSKTYFESIREVARSNASFRFRNICGCLRGTQKTHRGCAFKYA